MFLKDVLNIESKEAEKEAEKIKQAMSDNTVNQMAKYVHKVLGLNDLNCAYDINKERCRTCARSKINKKKE